ncbi:MAG: hypothetical protein JNL30_05740 [Rubrivivax sp.]|nr:hypothetical protein [Rubrivivax sp.]
MNGEHGPPPNIGYYRVLHPPLFSPKAGDPMGAARRWRTLKLPYLRVLGPLWSFGLRVGELRDEATLPGMDPRSTEAVSRALRSLVLLDTARAHGPLAHFHAPTLLRAEVQAFLQVRLEDAQAPAADPAEARLGLLALHTLPEVVGGDPAELLRTSLPVLHGAAPVGGPQNIVVSPFGDWPPPLTGAAPNDGFGPTSQLLPAVQLMHGKIRLRPDPRYLAKAREQLGLTAPPPADAVADADTVVLLPDGFCVAGGVVLPWTGQSVAGWFKATYRRLEAGAGPVQRVLKVWLDPQEPGHAPLVAAWRGHLAGLDRALRGGDGAGGGPEADAPPRWLHVAPGMALEPSHLYWPETGPADSPLFSRAGRAGEPALSIDGEGLLMRLADRALNARPLSVLTLQPDHFDLRRQGSAVVIEGVAGDEAPPAAPPGGVGVEAGYRFRAPTATLARAERLEFTYRGDGGTPVPPEQQAVRLALPLIETAEALRQATGVPRPEPTAPPELLWTFTPIAGGWLHWPLPNATAAVLARLVPDNADDVPAAPRSREIQGALIFGNVPLQPDHLAAERPWSLGLTGARRAPFRLRLDTAAGRLGAVIDAEVTLQDFEMSFEGFATATPFRQRPERLLPEAAERALVSLPLKAVSPNTLRGLEAQMWRQADQAGPHPRVRVEVLLRGLVLEAAPGRAATRVAEGAGVAWVCSFAGAADGDIVLDATAQRPWVWSAHPALPTVQTLPLAAAGRARNAPTEARALAPLQAAALPAGAEIGYVAALAMTRLDMPLAVQVRDPGTGRFAAAAFVRPAAGDRWRDEIGMAITTLPSATWFVGVPARPGDLPAATPGRWAGFAATVQAELRHDIALRDEHHAFARAPGPAAGGAGGPGGGAAAAPRAVPQTAHFTPLANNGPERGAERNGWDRVWRDLQRRVALAAADRRALLQREGSGPLRLVGVFGDTDYPLAGAVAIDERTQRIGAGDAGFDPAEGPRLQAIGAFALGFASDAVQPPRLEFLGLPAESDLLGLAGRFRRAGGEAAVTFGTAALARAGDGSFTDQHGLRSAAVPGGAAALVHVKTLTEAAGAGRSVRLVSLAEPIVCTGSEALQFWCADVPAEDTSTGGIGNPLAWFTASAADLERRANAAGLDLNHLAGFRWALGSPQVPAHLGLVIVQGLVFEPLELERLVQAGDAQPSRIEIGGRLRLPVGTPAEPALPRCEARATLIIERSSGGHAVRLLATDLDWPLADPEAAAGVAPALRLPSLPAPGATAAGSLRYRFGEDDMEVDVQVVRDADGHIQALAQADPGVPSPPAPGEGTIDFDRLWVDLRGAGVEGGRIVPRAAPVVALRYLVRVGPVGARVVGEATCDLLRGGVALAGLHHAFSEADRVDIEPLPAADTGASDPSGGAAVVSTGVALGPRHFAISWSAAAAGRRDRLWGALEVSQAQGALLAALEARPGAAGRVASYRVVDLETRARFELRCGEANAPVPAAGAQGTLQLDLDWLRGARSARTYRLRGELRLPNAFSWPELQAPSPVGDWLAAPLAAEWSRGFEHEAQLRFDGQHLRPQALADRRQIALAVQVQHRVTRVGTPAARRAGARAAAASRAAAAPLGSLTWRTFQIVRLLSLAGLRERLVRAATPAGAVAAGRDPTAFSPLISPNARPLIDQQVLPHVLHAGAADPGALTGRLAALLLQRLDAAGYGLQAAPLAVDLSHHALLAADAAQVGAAKLAAPLVLAGLPAVAFIEPAGVEPVLPPDPASPLRRAFAARPVAATTLYLAAADRYEAHVLPALEPALATQALRRVVDAQAGLDAAADCVACAALGFDAADAEAPDPQQPVFQAVVFRAGTGGGAPVLAAHELPAAGTAFQLSALFARLGDERPLALGFGVRAPLTLADFYRDDAGQPVVPPAGAVVFDPQVYRTALAALRDAAVRQLVPGPDALEPAAAAAAPAPAPAPVAAARPTLRLETLARDGRGVGTAAALEVDPVLPADRRSWARRTLVRNAPWAAVGLLTVRAGSFGFEPGSVAELVAPGGPGLQRPRFEPAPLAQPRARQAQCEALAPWAAADAGVMPGYVPLDVGPTLVHSDGGEWPAGTTDGPRLAATAATVGWALAGGAGALLEEPSPAGGAPHGDYWLADRESLALREARAVPAATPGAPSYDVTFALPPRYRLGVPRSLLPASHARPPSEEPATEFACTQSYAPARVATTRIAARAGAWLTTRLGLMQQGAAVVAGGGAAGAPLRMSWRGGETPVHLRLPRPALLARNDRPRASSHEAGHCSVGGMPTVVVHGPRAARAGADLEAAGLNRAPRSLWATRLVMVSPPGGIIGPDWDGAIELQVDALLGAADGARRPVWTIAGKALVSNGVRYQGSGSEQIAHTDGERLRLDDFSSGQASAAGALRALPAASEVTLTLDLVWSQDPQVVLNRQLRLSLWTAGPGGLAVPETPVYFRFDDPEFNDRLGGIAKLNRLPSPVQAGDDVVFAADRSQLRFDERLELALALRPQVQGVEVQAPFVADTAGLLSYRNAKGELAALRLGVERRRKVEGATASLSLRGARALTGAVQGPKEKTFRLAAAGPGRPLLHALSVDCTALQADTEATPAQIGTALLQPGDQLALSVFVEGAEGVLVTLTLDVVEEPTLPANPSAFAVLALEQAAGREATTGVALYANGPDATVIEIVDPRDLVEGLVRRRAVYQWRSFFASERLGRLRFALQKVNAVGGSWLPRLLGDWQVPGG